MVSVHNLSVILAKTWVKASLIWPGSTAHLRSEAAMLLRYSASQADGVGWQTQPRARLRLTLDPVLFDLAIQGRTTDTQQFRGVGNISLGPAEGLGDQLAFPMIHAQRFHPFSGRFGQT